MKRGALEGKASSKGLNSSSPTGGNESLERGFRHPGLVGERHFLQSVLEPLAHPRSEASHPPCPYPAWRTGWGSLSSGFSPLPPWAYVLRGTWPPSVQNTQRTRGCASCLHGHPPATKRSGSRERPHPLRAGEPHAPRRKLWASHGGVTHSHQTG